MEAGLYEVTIDRRVIVTMRDGVLIALTVYLPDAPGAGPFPTIVESVPYRKDDDCFARDYTTYTYLAQRGFAGVRIDVRGTGASTGILEDEYLESEQQDNIEVLGWVVGQPWSNGRVGMWGISWGGFSALQTAMLRPAGLEAIVAMHATHDRFACDVHYVGGSLHAGEQGDWPPTMITSNALPPDPDIFGEGWQEEWKRRLDSTPPWTLEWLKHQRRDSYWEHGSPATDYGAIECPTLLIGGWLDGYVDGILALAENLECPTRTIVGPWGHHRPATGEPGPTIDHLELMTRWFGHHLRDDDNGVMEMPTLTAFIRTTPPYDDGEVAGYWRAEPAWPLAHRSTLDLDLEALDFSTTTWSGPQWVGSHAPGWDRSGIRSKDGSADDAASMTFDSGPLDEEVEIIGTPVAHLNLSTDQPFGLVCVRLLTVAPDGSSHLITRGSRNLAFPDDLSSPVRPEPGLPIDVEVPLQTTSAVLQPGTRIRISISGADFPLVWPPPGRFRLTIDPSRSTLTLPLTSGDAEERALDLPPAMPYPDPPVRLLEDRSDSAFERHDGQTTYRRTSHTKELQPERGDLVFEFDHEWQVTVTDDDPGTTMVASQTSQSLSRPGWDVAVESSMEMSGQESLGVSIALRAFLNGTELWSRRWHEEIDREWM